MNCPHCHAPLVSDARFCPACGKATAPTESGTNWQVAQGAPDLTGREIAGRYRIVKKLGEGGMGAVYRAEQMSLKRQIVIKILRPELGSHQGILQRFSAEAQAVAKLSHPNTVTVFDYGHDTDGTLFIAMEYIEGRSLREAIQKEGPFSPQRALAIAMQVAASLSDAHGHAIVHRDLKPDNVMLQTRGKQRDVVRVLDFGIAKLRDDNRATQAAMTQAGDMLGTPQYMAPEQIKGEAVDGRTDVYALGCMIYEMVTARLPYEAPTIMAMLSKHLVEDPIPPTQRRPELRLPPAIDQLVLAAMAKDPNHRPATMDAYADMIAALFAQLPPDPNVTNQSGALSMQHGAAFAPGTPPPAGNLATAATGLGRAPTPYPMGPPPGVPAFPPPPGPPPGPPPMGPPPGMPQLAPPAMPPPQVAPTQPVGRALAPSPASAAPTVEVAAKKSRAPLYAVLGILALGGAGVGVWAATKGSKDSSTTASTPEATPAKQGDSWATDNTPSLPANTADTPSTPTSPPVKPPPVDPDGDDADDIDEPDVPSNTAITLAIPKGASIKPPAGFTKMVETQQAVAYSNLRTGEAVTLMPITFMTNDPTEIASQYAAATGMEVVSQDTIPSAGGARPFLAFKQGDSMLHMIVLYIGNNYRLMVLYVAPATAATAGGFEDKVEAFLTNGVRMP